MIGCAYASVCLNLVCCFDGAFVFCGLYWLFVVLCLVAIALLVSFGCFVVYGV